MRKLLRASTFVLALCIVLTSLAGCSFGDNKAETRTIKDIMGIEVEIPSKVEKVVNIANELEEDVHCLNNIKRSLEIC